MIAHRTTPGTLLWEERRNGFSEVVHNFTPAQAFWEACRCLYCYDAPCIKGCPAEVDVPEFIARIRSGNLLGAARIVYAANPFGSVCARVCPTEALCEKACTSRLLSAPVAIGHLQRFACDRALAQGKISFAYPVARKARVAVVGGGPAGLSCTHFLRLRGYNVTLFERERSLGGLMRWGIPAYRLPRAICEQEVGLIARGLEWQNAFVDESLARRIAGDFDAVFLGLGLGVTLRLGVPGEDSPQVVSADRFLRDVANQRGGSYDLRGKDVAVIGGGATAMDVARSALRLGAENVWVVYRRSQFEMPAFTGEYCAALQEGVQFLWLAAPESVAERDGRLHVIFTRLKLAGVGPDGRRTVLPTGEHFALCVDVLFPALGRKSDVESLGLSGRGIFLGGDLAGGGTVVRAVADGKEAASRIDRWLSGGAVSWAGLGEKETQ